MRREVEDPDEPIQARGYPVRYEEKRNEYHIFYGLTLTVSTYLGVHINKEIKFTAHIQGPDWHDWPIQTILFTPR